MIALFAQRVQQVLVVVIQRKPAMRQAKHTCAVRILARQQACAARRACWCSAECLAEQYSLFGQALNVWRWNSMTIGLHIAACVVRMNVENIGVHLKAPSWPLSRKDVSILTT